MPPHLEIESMIETACAYVVEAVRTQWLYFDSASMGALWVLREMGC